MMQKNLFNKQKKLIFSFIKRLPQITHGHI